MKKLSELKSGNLFKLNSSSSSRYLFHEAGAKTFDGKKYSKIQFIGVQLTGFDFQDGTTNAISYLPDSHIVTLIEENEERIEHPKNKEVFGTIRIIKNNVFPKEIFEATTLFGYEDWFETYSEAREWIQSDNEEEYSGKAGDDRADEEAYSRSESRYHPSGY